MYRLRIWALVKLHSGEKPNTVHLIAVWKVYCWHIRAHFKRHSGGKPTGRFQIYGFWGLEIWHSDWRGGRVCIIWHKKNDNMMSIWMITRVWVGRPKQWSGVLPLSSFPPIMASPACYTSHQTLGHQTPDPRSPCRQTLHIISNQSHSVTTGGDSQAC